MREREREREKERYGPCEIRYLGQKPASKVACWTNGSRSFDPFRWLQFKGEGAIGSTGLVRSYHEKYPLIDHSLIYNAHIWSATTFNNRLVWGEKTAHISKSRRSNLSPNYSYSIFETI